MMHYYVGIGSMTNDIFQKLTTTDTRMFKFECFTWPFKKVTLVCKNRIEHSCEYRNENDSFKILMFQIADTSKQLQSFALLETKFQSNYNY